MNPKRENECVDIMTRAMEADTGLRLSMHDSNAAASMRADCYKIRSKLKKISRSTHEPGSKLYNRTEFDALKMSIRQEKEQTFLLIYKEDSIFATYKVEEL